MIVEDYRLHKTQTAAMWSAMTSIRTGYHFWTAGTAAPDKILKLAVKFDERFKVFAHRETRARNRAKGVPGATLLIHPAVGGHRLDWVLFGTDQLPGEAMKDATTDAGRFVWNEKYELVQLPRSNNGVVWTYRLTKTYRNDLEVMAVEKARSMDREGLQRYMEALAKMPMFGGVRDRLKSIQDRAARVYMGRHGIAFTPIVFPTMKRVVSYDNPPLTLGRYVQAWQLGLREIMARFDEQSLLEAAEQAARIETEKVMAAVSVKDPITP